MRFEAASKLKQLTPAQFSKLNGITLDTEIVAQRCSFGLGQVLGATARSYGFQGPLVSLCDPQVGIEWCCTVFKKNGARYATDDEKVIAYNAGSVFRDKDGAFIAQSRAYLDKVHSVHLIESF